MRIPISPLAAVVRVGASLLFVLSLTAEVEAAWRVQITPEVRVATEVSDNVTFANKDQDAVNDVLVTLEPSLEWSLDRGDLRLEGRSRERFERFVENDQYDGSDPGHQVTLTWQLVERWTVELREDFQRTHNLDDVLTAGGIVVQRERRTTNNAGATLTYRPTERVTLSAAYTNQNSQSDFPRNSDYLLHMGQLTGSYQLTEQLGFSLGANIQDYDINPDPTRPVPFDRARSFTRNYGLFLGTGYQVSERFQFSAQVGERFTEQTFRGARFDTTFPFPLVEEQDTTSNFANTFSLSATYRLERGSITLNGSQDLTATAGAEGTVERRTLRLAADRWLTADWRLGGSAGYSTNKNDAQQVAASSQDSRSLNGNVNLTYRFNDEWSGGLSLRRLRYRNTANGTEVVRNSAVVTVTARWPHLL